MPKHETEATRVLVVEDDDTTRELLLALLPARGVPAHAVDTGAAAIEALRSGNYGVVLLDLHLPDLSGLEVLGKAQSFELDPLFIVMTGHGSVDTAVEAMKLGAFDYLQKPLRTEELLMLVERALKENATRRELARLRRRAGEGARGQMIGESPPMVRLWDLVEQVAPTRATVLITGETGTGKELVASAVHELSPRSGRPFVAANCSSLPETLLESELFGHLKGSFTGAISTTRGLFEEADRGTLFLDEISTISAGVQVKLLRVIQERVIQRVGGGNPIRVDFRLVAATNRDLEVEVRDGRFREDLLYRLNVFPIHVPPLRERKGDIPLLVRHFLMRTAEETGLEPPDVPAEVMRRLAAYAWPGNVRELQNVVERMVIRGSAEAALADGDAVTISRTARQTLERARDENWSLARLERERILQVLEQVGGHRTRAAGVLGIDRRTLYRKLREYEATADGVN